MEFSEIADVEAMKYEACKAIIVHRLKKPPSGDEDNYGLRGGDSIPESFVTIHRINGGQLCEGAPITKSKILTLCKEFLPSLRADAAYIPENVITHNPVTSTLIWWRPGGIRHLYFDKSTHIKSGLSPVPAAPLHV